MIDIIDVSANQAAIDWRAVASSGVAGAWIRCAEGVVPDRMFKANWAQSNAAGVPRGAYLYVRARHTADDLIEAVKHQLGDDPGELPVALDCETLDGASRAQFLDLLGDLVDGLDLEFNRAPVIYTGPSWWDTEVWPAHARISDGADGWVTDEWPPPLWLADYNAHPTLPHGWDDWTIWQYSGSARCPGIVGQVDRSRYRGTIDELMCLGVPRLVGIPTDPAQT